MRILITGANGFLGQSVVNAFLLGGHCVRAVVRPATKLDGVSWATNTEVEVVRADLRSDVQMDKLFDGIDVLVHLAATVIGDEDAQFNSTVVGTEKLLEAMRASSTRRVVLVSSFSVYDWRLARKHLDEQASLETDIYSRGGYAIAKLWQERVVRRYSAEYEFDLKVLRPGFIWGAGHTDIPGIIFSIGPLRLVLGINRPVPLTHVDNCARCFLLAAEMPEQVEFDTYNIVDSERITSWMYSQEYLARSGIGGVRVPLPFTLLKITAEVANKVRCLLFGKKGRLPSLLTPSNIAVFKPIEFRCLPHNTLCNLENSYTFAEACKRSFT